MISEKALHGHPHSESTSPCESSGIAAPVGMTLANHQRLCDDARAETRHGAPQQRLGRYKCDPSSIAMRRVASLYSGSHQPYAEDFWHAHDPSMGSPWRNWTPEFCWSSWTHVLLTVKVFNSEIRCFVVVLTSRDDFDC